MERESRIKTDTTVFFGDIFRQIVAYCTNPTKFKIADTTNGGDLLLERESRIMVSGQFSCNSRWAVFSDY